MNWDCIYCNRPMQVIKSTDYSVLHCNHCGRTVGIRRAPLLPPMRGQLDIDGKEAA